MKRNSFLFLAAIMILFSTGCKKERVLECTKNEEQSGIQMNETVKITFKGNNVENVNSSVDAVLGDTYKNYKNLFITTIESQFKNYKDLKGVDIKVSDTDDTVTATLNADLNKMDDAAKNKFNIVDTKANYEKTKESLEKQNYSCK